MVDTDNNNKAAGYKGNTDYSVKNYLPKITQQEQHNDKKLYKNLKSFDPLNSGI